MKNLLGAAVVFVSMVSVCQAAGPAYQEATRSGGSDKAVVIQNSEINTNAKTKDINASDRATVDAATVDVTNGATIQNSKINAASDTGNIKASDDAKVNAGGVKIH